MRAEDVKPGMWVQRESPFTEDAIVFQFGNQADNRRAWQAIYRDGSVGWCSHDTLHECEPWVPRVGEWVRLVRTDGVEEMRGPVVSFSTGHLVTFKPPDRACQFWGAAHGHHGGGWYVEPCAPPEAKTSIGLVWLDDGRARSDRDDAAIETLRELLLHRAKVNADSSRAWSAVNHQLRADYAELADSAERRACIAIALALLL